MSSIEKVLTDHAINFEVIYTPSGPLLMADNGDTTYTQFRLYTPIDKVYQWLGY
jgi:hypothetical protein